MGEESCADIKCETNPCDGAGRITSVEDMTCSGTNSCKESKIKTMASIQCSGNRACYGSRIEARSDTDCNGHYACSNTQITTNHQLSCNGMGSCYKTNMEITKTVDVNGYFGASYSTISAAEIHSFGYLSTAFTTIDSEGREQIDIKLFGHYAGYGSSVICRKGSLCSLTCKGTGCKNVDYICLDGSECNVKPSICADDPSVDGIDDIDCPNIVRGLSESDKLESFKEQRLNDAQQEAFWMETLDEIKFGDDEFELLQSGNMKKEEDELLFGGIFQVDGFLQHLDTLQIQLISGLVLVIIAFIIMCHYRTDKDNKYHSLQ